MALAKQLWPSIEIDRMKRNFIEHIDDDSFTIDECQIILNDDAYMCRSAMNKLDCAHIATLKSFVSNMIL